MKKKFCSFVLIALLAAGVAGATGKVYSIIMGATLDSKIGQSCKVDLDVFQNEVFTLAGNLNYDNVPTIRLDGSKCDRQHMEQAINQLRSCTTQDIVFFYYTGHGGRSTLDKSRFPQMVMNYNDPRNYIAVHEVVDKIASLPAHLKLVVTDCCNNKSDFISPKDLSVQSRGATNEQVDYKQLEKLFLQNKGTIVASSSDVGQVSYCDNDGGYFSLSFWSALSSAATGDIKAEWNDVMKRTELYTLNKSRNQQKPIYDLNISPTVSPTPSQPVTVNTPPQQPVVGNADTNSSLLSAIGRLLNRDEPVGSRLNLIDGIVSSYFAGGSTRVQTVGRNMVTIIDTEDVPTFLRRLCFDNKIRQINVITDTKDSNGRCTYLKVHEVRLPLQ